MRRNRLSLGLLLVLFTFSCGDSGTAPVTVVDIDLSLPATVEGGASLALTATPRGAGGEALTVPVEFSTTSTATLRVDGTTLYGLAPGTGTVRARAGTATATATVEVVPGPPPSFPANLVIQPDERIADRIQWGQIPSDPPIEVQVVSEERSISTIAVLAGAGTDLQGEGPGTAAIRVRGPGTEWVEGMVEVRPDGPLVYQAFNVQDTVRLVGHDLSGVTGLSVAGTALSRASSSSTVVDFVGSGGPQACGGLGEGGAVEVAGASTRGTLRAAVPRPYTVPGVIGQVYRLPYGTRCIQFPAGIEGEGEYAVAVWDRVDYRRSIAEGWDVHHVFGGRVIDQLMYLSNYTFGVPPMPTPPAPVADGSHHHDHFEAFEQRQNPTEFEEHGIFQRREIFRQGDTVHAYDERRGYIDYEVVGEAPPNLVLLSPMEDLDDPDSWPLRWRPDPRPHLREALDLFSRDLYSVLDQVMGEHGRPLSSHFTGQKVIRVADHRKEGLGGIGSAGSGAAHPDWWHEHGPALSNQVFMTSQAWQEEGSFQHILAHEVAHVFQHVHRWYGLRQENPLPDLSGSGPRTSHEGGADFLALEAMGVAMGINPLGNEDPEQARPWNNFTHGGRVSHHPHLSEGYSAWAGVLRYLMEQRMVSLGEDHFTAFQRVALTNEAGFSHQFRQFGYFYEETLEDAMREVEPEWTMEDWVLHYLLSRLADDRVTGPRLQDHRRYTEAPWGRLFWTDNPAEFPAITKVGGSYIARVQDSGFGGSFFVRSDAADEDVVIAVVRIR